MTENSPSLANARQTDFVNTAVSRGEVWYLTQDSGVLYLTIDDQDVLPVWAHDHEASACAAAQYPNSVPARLALVDFVRNWLPDLESRDIWV